MASPAFGASVSSHPSISTSSTLSEDPLAPFASLLARIKPQSILALASRTRLEWSHCPPQNNSEHDGHSCTLVSPPNCGSFNLLHTLVFSDGLKWILRIPCADPNGCYSTKNIRSLRSETMTMGFIRSNTTIPIPEVITFDETTNNEISAPYIIMKFVEGSPVSEKWFEDIEPSVLEARRLRTLDTLAMAMVQLRVFSFPKIGSFQFDRQYNEGLPSDAGSPPPTITIGPCFLPERIDFPQLHDPEHDESPIFKQIGPFDNSRDFLDTLLNDRQVPEDPFSHGIYKLLRILIGCLPPSQKSLAEARDDDDSNLTETFQLTHPDFGSQNILISDDGTLTSIIDWDNTHTVPRWIGPCRYPSWITRDWDPSMYCYGNPEHGPEGSPEELARYRRRYSETMCSLIPQADHEFMQKSHLFEAIWVAANDPMCVNGIVKKIFLHVFPTQLQEEGEQPALYLYDVVVALARGDLGRKAEERLVRGFKILFSVSSSGSA